MFRYIAFAICLFATQLTAEITSQELRNIAYNGDIDGMEEAFAALHAEQVAGRLPASALRQHVADLAVSHPDIMDFVKNWQEARPRSPYALSVRAWQISALSFRLRGTEIASRTPRNALREFATLQTKFMNMGMAAYDLAPDFTPASDAVFVGNSSLRYLDLEELDAMRADVLGEKGEVGSLLRSLQTLDPKWGGEGLPYIYEVCENHVHRMRHIPAYDPIGCTLANAISLNIGGAAQNYLYELMGHRRDPFLAQARINRAFYWDRDYWHTAASNGIVPAREDEQAFVLSYLANDGAHDLGSAILYMHVFGVDEDSEEILTQVVENGVENARQRLRFDPLNPALISDLGAKRTLQLFSGHSVSIPNDGSRDYISERMVLIQPYHVANWERLVSNVKRRSRWSSPGELAPRIETVSSADQVYVKGLITTDYEPELLQGFVMTKVGAFRDYAREFEDPGTYTWVPLTDEQGTSELICPAIRLKRLYDAQCEYRSDCPSHVGWSRDDFDKIYKYATQRDACRWEKTAPVGELYFEDVPLVLDRAYQGIENRD